MQRLRILIVALLLLATAAPASAQRRPAGLAPDLYKSGRKTRDAFIPVVAAAREATVRIHVDGEGAALGVIVDADGYVVTKASELTDDKIVVQVRDGTKYDAQIIGVHRDNDLAMLKIDAKDLKTIAWATGDEPEVGQWVATVGRTESPVAVGVISTPSRKIDRLGGVLGVRIGQAEEGVAIEEVYDGSGAKDAGLQPGDIVTGINGEEVKTMQQLQLVVRSRDPGQTLAVTFLRDGKEMKKDVTLGARHAMLSQFDRNARQQRLGGALSKRMSGFPAVLQHDTVLRPQDVGGPLVNLDGQAVGLNIARAGRVETYAIPAKAVRKILKPMKDGKFKPE